MTNATNTTRYVVTVTDSDTAPAWLQHCSRAIPGEQDGGRCNWHVVTSSPADLEAALDADPVVIAYRETLW